MSEEWRDCDWVGTIKKHEPPKPPKEPIENWDDYDERRRGESQWKDLM